MGFKDLGLGVWRAGLRKKGCHRRRTFTASFSKPRSLGTVFETKGAYKDYYEGYYKGLVYYEGYYKGLL